MPDPRLQAAYAAADYRILAPRPFTLHVGEANAVLRALHALMRVTGSVVVSAWNPLSQPRAAAENEAAHTHLLAAVSAGGWLHVPAVNRDPRGEWPDEPSVLVLGPDLEAALELGRRFGQAAVLFNAADGVPQILWCRGAPERRA